MSPLMITTAETAIALATDRQRFPSLQPYTPAEMQAQVAYDRRRLDALQARADSLTAKRQPEKARLAARRVVRLRAMFVQDFGFEA